MKCMGRNLDDHCCYVDGRVCQFLEEGTESGYRWSCGLRRELGSWDAVLEDPRYQPLRAHFESKGYNCKTWPNGPCNTCGYKGPEA